MSESTFPFATTAEPEAGPLDDEPSGDSRKKLLVVGGLVGALALGASAFLLLGGSAEDEADLGLAVPAAAPAAPAPEAAPEAVVVPAASTETVGRNPFKARYVAPTAVAAGAAPSTAPTPAPEAVPLTPVPLPQAPVVVVQPPAPAPAPAEYPLTLKAVEPTGPTGVTYTFVVDGKDTQVVQGQRFGKYGELVVLALESTEEGPKAVLQVGDANPLRVKVGETVNVL